MGGFGDFISDILGGAVGMIGNMIKPAQPALAPQVIVQAPPPKGFLETPGGIAIVIGGVALGAILLTSGKR